jgi:hypothetical protein
VSGGGHWITRQTVNAKDLLAGGVGPPGEVARFYRSLPAANSCDSGDIHFFIFEIIDERATGCVVTDRANRKYTCAESDNVIRSIRTTAGDEFCFAMAKDKDWSFARNARNFAKYKSVRDEIPKNSDGLLGKDFDQIFKPA